MELIHILETAVNAVFPVVLVTFLGYFLRRIGFLPQAFISTGSRLSFNVLMPCMLFVNVYSIENFSVIRWDVVVYCIAVLLVIFLLGMATSMAVTPVPERKGVILQAAFRSNMAIVGLSLAGVLGGEEAVAMAAIVSACTLPLMNIFAVISLTVFLEGSDKVDIGGILKNIAKNPIILGILAGMVCLLIRGTQLRYFGSVMFSLNGQLEFLYNALVSVKAMTSPFALMILGAQFDFSASKGMLREIIAGIIWRVILAPVIGIGAAVLLTKWAVLDFGVNEFPALIALFGTPTAVSSAIMAGQMKNDEQLATQLVVWTSICSVATMFLTVCLLMAEGLLIS